MLLCGATLSLLFSLVLGAKIVFVPFPYFSHVMEIDEVGKELRKNKHDLYMILPTTFPTYNKVKDEGQYKLLPYHNKFPVYYELPEMSVLDYVDTLFTMSPKEDFRTNVVGWEEFCLNALSDSDYFTQLNKLNFDLAIVDCFPSNRCMLVLMYRLKIPYICVTTQYEPWLFRSPSLPSFVPFALDIPYSEQMTFWERLHNTWSLLDWIIAPRVSTLSDSLITEYAPEMPPVTLNYLAGRSVLWLFDSDIAIDHPRPTMPNVIDIGGLSTKDAKPLPKDLKKLADGATDGLIIVSFGSFVDILPVEIIDKILAALGQLPQTVIFRFSEARKAPKNVHILPWIPQQDLLGHKNTKLFVTHSGANGQFEALYHGVPMLGCPIFGDQPYNARRVAYKGFGQVMSLNNFTQEEMGKKIKELIDNPKYITNIQKGSKIFKSHVLPPRQRAVYWIEHVLEFGGDHLHSIALDLPWYQYVMLDIFCFVVGTIFVVVMVTWCIVKQLMKCCFGSRQKVKLQ